MDAERLPIRFGPGEWTGALGDLGTFLPLYLSLVALNGLPAAKTLALVGAAYIATGVYFGLPMPVQPLKAMAAIAIAKGMGPGALAAGGLWMGCILLALSLTGIEWLSRWFTRPIVKGIQLGVGLMLLKAGVLLLTGSTPASAASGAPIAAGASPWPFLWPALWLLVVPQLPLTLGNAVFAVSDVARDYFGEHAARAAPRQISLSLGMANLAMGSLGGLPICHGSGGLTAHYKFGARSAGATIILGTSFLLLAAIFSGNVSHVLARIPVPLLGVMVLYVGLCHALLIRGLESKRPVAWAMGLIGLATGNLAYSLAFGLAAEFFQPR